MEPSYHNTVQFGNDCGLIYDRLKTSPYIGSVYRVASGIPQYNGVVFYWQNKLFRINWFRGHWYVGVQSPCFCTARLDDLTDFCLLLVTPRDN